MSYVCEMKLSPSFRYAFFIIFLVIAWKVQGADLDWLTGPWIVEYEDAELGRVRGVAEFDQFGGNFGGIQGEESVGVIGGKLVLVGPDNKRYPFDIHFVNVREDDLEFQLRGRGPPSGFVFEPEKYTRNAVSVPAKEGDVLKATWGEEKTTARIRKFEPVDLRIRFPVPNEENLEELRGEWDYETIHPGRIGENRAGEIEVKSTHVEVKGREVWRRPRMQLKAVYSENLAPIDQLPSTPEGFTPPVWLNVAGFSLPVESKRRAIVTSLSPYVRVLPNTRRHPEEREVMQFLAQIRTDLTPEPVVFEINGQKVSWLPEMHGQEPIAVRLTRRRSEVEYDAIREAGIGDILYLESEYETVPFCGTQIFGLIDTDLYDFEASDKEIAGAKLGALSDLRGKNENAEDESTSTVQGKKDEGAEEDGEEEKAEDDFREYGNVVDANEVVSDPYHARLIRATLDQEVVGRVEVRLRRTKNPRIFRSGPIYILEKEIDELLPEYDEDDFDGPVIEVQPFVDELLCWEIDSLPHSNPKTLVTVPATDSINTSIWADALERAQKCREEGAQTSYWNMNWFELASRGTPGAEAVRVLDRAQSAVTGQRVFEDESIFREEPISVEDHAAAIVLRDQLVANLQEYQNVLGRMENLTPEGIAAIVQAALNKDYHPLLPIEINVPHFPGVTDGLEDYKWPLSWMLGSETYENWFALDEENFMEFAKKAITAANSKASIDTGIALTAARQLKDCDTMKMLELTGRGMDSLIERVKPTLIKRNPDEDGPRYVPDREAIRAITGVKTKLESIEGIEGLSNAELDVLITAASVGVGGLQYFGAKYGVRALMVFRVSSIAGATLTSFDTYRAYDSTQIQVQRLEDEVVFSRGILGVAGDQRYVQTTEKLKSAYANRALVATIWVVSNTFTINSLADDIKTKNFGVFTAPGWKNSVVSRGAQVLGIPNPDDIARVRYSRLFTPDQTSAMVHKAMMEGWEGLAEFEKWYLVNLWGEISIRPSDFSELDRSVARLFGHSSLPIDPGMANLKPKAALFSYSERAPGAVANAIEEVPVIGGSMTRTARRELRRLGVDEAKATELEMLVAEQSEIWGVEEAAMMVSMRNGMTKEMLLQNGVSEERIRQTITKMKMHYEVLFMDKRKLPLPDIENQVRDNLMAQKLADLGYRESEIERMLHQINAVEDLVDNRTVMISQALDSGRTVEELLDAGFTELEIMKEIDFRRIQSSGLEALPSVVELAQKRGVEGIQYLRELGYSQDDLMEPFLEIFAQNFDGKLFPDFEEMFVMQFQGFLGEEISDTLRGRITQRFGGGIDGSVGTVASPGLGGARRSATVAAGGNVVAFEPTKAKTRFIVVEYDGGMVRVPVGRFLGRGSFNMVFEHPTNPRYVIRVNFHPASRGMDELGEAGLKRVYAIGKESEGMLRGPKRRFSLNSDCAEELGHSVEKPFRRGNTVEYIEIGRGRAAGSYSNWHTGNLTRGQALEIYRNLRALNREGYILLDSHGGNIFLERVPGTADEWRMHIIDKGSVVQVRPDFDFERAARAEQGLPPLTEAQERAARAERVQRQLVAPEGGVSSDVAQLFNETRTQVFEELDDSVLRTLGTPENLHYRPELSRFNNLRTLVEEDAADVEGSLGDLIELQR